MELTTISRLFLPKRSIPSLDLIFTSFHLLCYHLVDLYLSPLFVNRLFFCFVKVPKEVTVILVRLRFVPGGGGGGGNFLMSGIRVCATNQGRFFTSRNPEQAPHFVVLLQNRPYFLKFYSRTGSFFDNLVSNTLAQISKIPVAFGFCFLQPDVFTFVLLYLSKVFQAFYNWDQFESGHLYSSLNLT